MAAIKRRSWRGYFWFAAADMISSATASGAVLQVFFASDGFIDLLEALAASWRAEVAVDVTVRNRSYMYGSTAPLIFIEGRPELAEIYGT